jgi:hypothetical protein
MDLAALLGRKGDLESSLKQIEQSFHMVTGHLAEVNYQISLLPPVDEPQVESPVEPVVE